jgi:hypothetical protein
MLPHQHCTMVAHHYYLRVLYRYLSDVQTWSVSSTSATGGAGANSYDGKLLLLGDSETEEATKKLFHHDFSAVAMTSKALWGCWMHSWAHIWFADVENDRRQPHRSASKLGLPASSVRLAGAFSNKWLTS